MENYCYCQEERSAVIWDTRLSNDSDNSVYFHNTASKRQTVSWQMHRQTCGILSNSLVFCSVNSQNMFKLTLMLEFNFLRSLYGSFNETVK